MISSTCLDGDCAICATGPLKAYSGFAAFRILVADHRLHFTANTLRASPQRAGFRVVLLSTGIVSTELTVVGARDATISLPTETAPAESGGRK